MGGGLTAAAAAVGVVAGVWGRPVAPQAGVALAVGARGMAAAPAAAAAAELGGAAAGADGGLSGEEPATHWRGGGGGTALTDRNVEVSRS